MDYVLKPTLENMVLTKIAVTLWNQHDGMSPTGMHLLSSLTYEGHKLWRDKVIGKVPGLLLPEPLKKKVVKFIGGIGWEISKWREHDYRRFNLDLVLPSELCWTPLGTVDTKKTARALIKNENIEITSRYMLACDYCLEDDIPKLWDKTPENLRVEYYSYAERLVLLWTYRINGEMDILERRWGNDRSPYYYAFDYAVRHGNKVATEYLLQRLTHEEREDLLVKSAKFAAWEGDSRIPFSLYFPDVLCFLFSQMDECKVKEVFRECALCVLWCLLQWPWQRVFMETANRMWDFLSGKNFRVLLATIVSKVIDGYKDCNYQKLFAEFWQQSPIGHKKYIINECKTHKLNFLLDLFELEDKENVRLVLNSATVEERESIICSPVGKKICKRLVLTYKWDLLKFFLEECLSSKESVIKFKELKAHIIVRKLPEGHVKYSEREHERGKFFQLLDDLIQENNKRSAEAAGKSTSVSTVQNLRT